MNIKYKAPLNDNTGLGQASRDILEILKKSNYIENLSIEVINISPCPDLHVIPSIKEITTTLIKGDYEICFIFCPPYQFNRFVEKDKINIGYTMWETQNIPKHFIENVNLLNALIVPIKQNVSFFEPHIKNIFQLPLPLLENKYDFSKDKYNKFTFYSIYEWTERKCPLEAIQAFFLEFKENDDVDLILKLRGNPIDIYNKLDILKKIMKLNKYKNIKLITDEWDKSKIKELHNKSHCYIGVSKGEGWNLPLMDAILYGNLAISTDTGCVEYLPNVLLVDGSYEPVMGMIHFEHFNSEQNWIIPSINSIRKNMRKAYEIWKENKMPNENDWQQTKNIVDFHLSVSNLQNELKKIFEEISNGKN